MRISGTCFARLRDDDGRYALLVNKGRLTRNRTRILSPIGGGYDVYPDGMLYLRQAFDAHDFEGHHANELRFRVADGQVAAVAAWFRTGTQRERSVLRELTEELTEETGLLTPADLRGTTERYHSFHRDSGVTTRDVPEQRTAYFMEVFDVTLPRPAMRKLLVASRLPVGQRWIYFVTPEEITGGVTWDGVKIGPISRCVV